MRTDRIQQLLSFIDEQPDDPFNVYALAMEYRDEQPQKALHYLKKLLDEHPSYLATYYHAAALYAEQENRTAAQAVYEKGIALAREQKNEKAFQELSRAYRAFQDDDEF